MSETLLAGPESTLQVPTSTKAARPGASTEHGTFHRIDEWIQSHPARAFSLLTLLYAVVVVSLSSLKLLWLDELITLHVARLGSATAIWNALAQGADPNPPVTHLLVHFSRALFGEHEFALRLPAVIGYWVGLLCLFQYLRGRVSAVWALSGTVLSMMMAAFDYSFDSRSYAIFYGFTMLAFLCWTRTSDSPEQQTPRRTLALVGMTFALAAAISTNYFAVLAFFPVAAGEAARTIRRFVTRQRTPSRVRPASLARTIDLPVWIGLAIAATPLLAYRGMIAHSIAEFAPYAWNKVSLGQAYDSYTEMVEIALYPVLALLLFAALVQLLSPMYESLCTSCRRQARPRWFTQVVTQRQPIAVPPEEFVAISCLLLYPILGYIVASIRGGMLSPRFVIPVCFGFAIAGTFAAFRMVGQFRRAGVLVLGFYLAWFLCRESFVGYSYEEQKQCFYKVLAHLPEAEASVPSNVPIAIPDPLLALTFQHYAPAALQSRLVFPIDFPAVRAFRGDDSPEENLWHGRVSLYTLPVTPLASFQHETGDYLILASDGNWMVQDLERHRYPVDRLPVNTRAGAIGGFTPLCKGVPAFFTARGDQAVDSTIFGPSPVPFRVADNLPTSTADPRQVPPPTEVSSVESTTLEPSTRRLAQTPTHLRKARSGSAVSRP